MTDRAKRVALGACAALALFVLVYPVYVIRPFRFQGAWELAFALGLLRIRTIADVVLVVAALALCFSGWKSQGTLNRKIMLAASTVAVVAFAALSRVNIYELMFHPLDRATFSDAQRAKLDGDEEVIAINVGPTARAYPIRSMSYHHIVNDIVGGEPIVSTY